MSKQKPKIFIGSSSEGLPVARAIRTELDNDANCVVWNQGFFGLNLSTLDGLMEGIKRFNFTAKHLRIRIL
jgi:predicted nucleotide-binding protein